MYMIVIIFRHIYKMWVENLHLFYPLFADCVYVKRCSFTFLNVIFFTFFEHICRRMRNSKISQNEQIFFKIARCGNFVV